MDTFVGRDPSLVGVDEVAARVGVSRSLVYAYFGDRAGLLTAVHDALAERLAHAVGLGDAAAGDPAVAWSRDAFAGVVRAYLEFARDNPGEWQLTVTLGAMSLDGIRAARRRHGEQLARTLGGGPGAVLLARAVVGLVESGAGQWREQEGEMDLDGAVELLTRVGWDGLAGLVAVTQA